MSVSVVHRLEEVVEDDSFLRAVFQGDTDMEFECREAAIAWICANQLGRRNITEETRKFLIGMQYESEKVVTRIRNKIGKNQHTVDISSMNEEEADKACRHWTAQRIAEENNVSAATVLKFIWKIVRHLAFFASCFVFTPLFINIACNRPHEAI